MVGGRIENLTCCYRDGAFVNPEIDTPQKMHAFCIEKMCEVGMPRIIARSLTRSIPRLERWRTDPSSNSS